MTKSKDKASTIEKFSNFIKKVSINHSMRSNSDHKDSIFVNIFNKDNESNKKIDSSEKGKVWRISQ